MAIWNLFSQREEEAANAGVTDVYQYDEVPGPLRIQVAQIATEGIGLGSSSSGYMMSQSNEWWDELEGIFLREKGMHSLNRREDARLRFLSFMETCSVADWLDMLELIAVGINIVGQPDSHNHRYAWGLVDQGEKLIEEINYRLRRAKLGFQIEDARLVRVDSQFIHAEVVKPALALLSKAGFEGPSNEFREAHRHYRDGDYRQAVAMAANAFESTFKAIFDKKGWSYKKGSRISDLVKVGRAHGLWPDYLDASFDQLLATLQSGLPKIRDNDAAHGQGSEPKELPAYVAAFALHLAASKIVFIVGAATHPGT
ncbi:STM4504/CBY_0614 family protein [Sphingomonas sp. 2SG]|uniref:STM4504/CBY_0614 family protein n=1 Tax=Sphingomonas sp. 2SG TaxID=2502201 RepID=UPI0010F96F6E|nr:HEPN domain-containing protein [Sphingomonas sp. 2SG]